MEKIFFIPFNTPSSKNGKFKGINASKAVVKWRRLTKGSWQGQRDEFKKFTEKLPTPILFVHMTFIKSTAVLFDYYGPGETIMDEMVEKNWVNDDNAYQLVPVFGKFRIDKENPGCEIRILSQIPKYEFL